MWRPCATVLDKPAQLWILSVDDLGLFLAVALGGGMLCDLLWSLAAGAIVTACHRRWRRGKPAGALLHLAHACGLFRIPGVLSRHPTLYKAW